MNRYSQHSDGQPKSGGAYTGWRPRQRSRWHWLGLLPLAACVVALTLKVFQ